MKPHILWATTVALWSTAGFGQDLAEDETLPDGATIEEMVITGVRTDEPLKVVTDPKLPRQPLPAQDGADYLKTIPGFSVIRKGGTGGDPVFRGMAGSRLSVLVDGEAILGGCSNRMDPPTAYIYPEAFDSIEVIKGPQSVQHGPGLSAGIVLFEHDQAADTVPGWNMYASALGGSFGRHGEVVDASLNNSTFALQGSATNAVQDDYQDGDGVSVHSAYQRWSTQITGAWTPGENTRVELSGARSDGEAAYADRGVDGSKFARDNYGLKFSRTDLGPVWQSIDFQASYNYVDHVMDNYSLRELAEGATAQAMNPDRETTGARLALGLKPGVAVDLVIGIDAQRNIHTTRMSMNQFMMPYQDIERLRDAEFTQVGPFAEFEWGLDQGQNVVGGIRVDAWEASDLREVIPVNMMLRIPNPTFGEVRKETLQSGFLRYEKEVNTLSSQVYVGLGYNERFPDYWELISKESADSVSAFNIDAEKTTQLDIGLIYKKDRLYGSISSFYNEISDFILIQSAFEKPVGDMGARTTTIARNIDARSWGLEMDATYALSEHWHSEFTLASVRGANDTDQRTLPQLPPLEARLGIYFDSSRWSGGLLWRGIDSQNRVDPNRGNIVGQDIAATGAVSIFSVNAGWQPTRSVLVTAGVDNLFDRTYAEFISRSGASVPGFDQTTRVNEPGRTLWLKAQFTFAD